MKVPESIKNCRGAPSVYDVQADEMPLTDFQALTDPLPVLRLLICFCLFAGYKHFRQTSVA